MRVLFDQGTPEPLRRALTQHEIVTAYELGWSKLTNGELLDAAEKEGFGVFVTTDANLKHQQNTASHRIAVVVLTATSWPRIQRAVGPILLAIERAAPGSYTEVQVPSTRPHLDVHMCGNQLSQRQLAPACAGDDA